ELIALMSAAQTRHAFAAKAEGGAALRRRRNFQGRLTEKRRHFDCAAERCERELDRNLAEQILALPLEQLVLLHAEHDVQIARLSARHAGFAVARRAQA